MMIQANCRTQFTVDDFQFLVETLTQKAADKPSLTTLLSDPTTLDRLLDHDTVWQSILNRRDCLRISPHLYFYVIARRVLRNVGIHDYAVADYLGALLTQFSEASRLHRLSTHPGQPFEYISDLLAVLREAPLTETFFVRAHLGNYTLFMTGVFPQHIEHRARYKGAPNLPFYEGVGSQNFRLLAEHAFAYKRRLDAVFNCLGEQFHAIRLALNDMADRLLHLDTSGSSVADLLQLLVTDVA